MATWLSVLLAVCWVVVGCRERPPEPVASDDPVEIRLVDGTDEAGLRAEHRSAWTTDRYLPETMGAGVAIFDADGDRRPDVYVVGGLAVDELGVAEAEAGATLWIAREDGTFENRTAGSGLDVPQLGMGVAVGDVDNDGDLDLFVSGVGVAGEVAPGDHLFSNRGDGRFDDVTVDWGLGSSADAGFSSSVAFLDYDRDGWLDLFVGRYVDWSPATDLACLPDGVHRSYCTPEAYPGVSNRLYRNIEGRRFVDVTTEAGLELSGKALGVAVVDLEDDLWPDLVVANDTVRNFLFRNLGDGRFEEIGLESGIALGQSGAPRGAMGVDVGDLDGNGTPEVVIGNFAQEMSAVYRLTDGGMFVDEAAARGIGLSTLMPLAFGVQTLDLDLDGRLDLVFVHGHIEPEIERFQPSQRHAQRPLAFYNRDGTFVEVTADGALAEPLVGRGLASGDLDGDGDLDLVITQNGGPARLWRNESPVGHFLRFVLEGSESNRTGYGACVEVSAGDQVVRRCLRSGRSYLSASEPVLTVGLGEADHVDEVTIHWPSGRVQVLGLLGVDRLHVVTEP